MQLEGMDDCEAVESPHEYARLVISGRLKEQPRLRELHHRFQTDATLTVEEKPFDVCAEGDPAKRLAECLPGWLLRLTCALQSHRWTTADGTEHQKLTALVETVEVRRRPLGKKKWCEVPSC